MSNSFRLCGLFSLILIVAGCGPRFRLSESFLTEDCPAGSAAVVAEDLAQTLALDYPPGHTTIFLSQTGAPNDELGPALETALRAQGFTLVPETGDSALTVAYVLDRFKENFWFAKLTVSDGLIESRVYHLGDGGLEAQAITRTGETRHE